MYTQTEALVYMDRNGPKISELSRLYHFKQRLGFLVKLNIRKIMQGSKEDHRRNKPISCTPEQVGWKPPTLRKVESDWRSSCWRGESLKTEQTCPLANRESSQSLVSH